MKKNLLFKKLISCRVPILAFLLAICTCYSAFAQSRQITGKVTSSDDGSALPGVSVRLKGTALGTVTDINGVFKISAANGAVLTFSFIGYNTTDVTVTSENIYNLKLSPDARTLAEVNVVSVGYGTQKRQDLTGSIGSVSAATIDKAPVVSADQALQGRIAGVQVMNNDASPGGNISILVRGVGSLASGGNDPLYVVDGYPLEAGGINNINPTDIASIDVLKDASATAIYGIRAANGVVLITTKKGKKDGAVVQFDAYNEVQGKPKEFSVLSAQQFATLANSVATDPTQNFQTFSGWANPASLHNIDWQNEVYGTGLTQNYSLAFRGGSDKVQTASSVSYYDQKGIVLDSYFKRVTLSLNADYQPVKWLRSSTNFKYTYANSANPFGTNSLVGLSELPPTLDGGNLLTNLPKDANGNYGFYNPTYTRILSYNNPLYQIETQRNNNINNFILANTSLEASIFDGLKLKTNAGVNISDFSGSFFTPEDDRENNQYGSGARIITANYSQNMAQVFDWLWENTLTYDKTFGKHAINFIAGASEQKRVWSGMGGSGIPPNGTVRDLATVTNLQLNTNSLGTDSGNGSNITALQSYFGRATYQYDSKYILTGTLRRDGSSKFAPGHQFGTFPSGAIAWKAKSEDFLKNVSWLSDLKLRGSYGEVGNQGPIPSFQFQALYHGNFPASQNGTNADNLGYPFNKLYQAGIAAAQPANDNLRWETDYQTDIGIDAAFLHGDLTLTADWYDRRSKDFLLTLAAPAQSGFNFLTRNVGSMENRGLEFAINYNHKANSDLTYGVNLTLATVSNKLTSITSGTTFVTNFGGLVPAGDGWGTYSETHIGQGVGEFYGYKSLGIFQTQGQINALNANAAAKNGSGTFYQQSVTVPGDRYFADTNGDGKVDATDETSLGSPLPKFYGGLNFDVTYKAFDINLYFYGVYGNKIFDYEASTLQSFQNRSFVGIENVSVDYYNNYWTPTRPSNSDARVTANDDVEQSGTPSSRWVENGSFLKLKNLKVGYTLPSDWTRKISVTKVRVYVSTQNLFTITSYTGIDPEIGIQGGNATQNGIDTGIYPSSKFYTIGLDVTL